MQNKIHLSKYLDKSPKQLHLVQSRLYKYVDFLQSSKLELYSPYIVMFYYFWENAVTYES